MLLRVLTQVSKNANSLGSSEVQDGVSQAALTLAEACIHAAKHSHSLIIHQWTSGNLPIFGYFHAQYLFSAAMVMLISSLISPENATSDMEAFQTGAQVLRCMSGDGNFAASEFSKNIEGIKSSLDVYRSRQNPTSHDEGELRRTGIATESAPLSLTTGNGDITTAFGSGMNASMRNAPGGFTTEMAFLEPTMQTFLAQSDFDLGLLNPADMSGDTSNALYFWNTPQWTE